MAQARPQDDVGSIETRITSTASLLGGLSLYK